MATRRTRDPAQAPQDLGLVEVPILERGADPAAERARTECAVETLFLDRRLFADGEVSRPFGYTVSEADESHLGNLARAGDLVILDSRFEEPASPEEIYAVRSRGTIVLSRVEQRGNVLLLPRADGSPELPAVVLPLQGSAADCIVGKAVLFVHRRPLPEPPPPGGPAAGGESEFPPSELKHLASRIDRAEAQGRESRWVGNDDIQRHHHGAINLNRDPFYLSLSWKRGRAAPVHPIGFFKLHLSRLLERGYIRDDSIPGKVRVRIYHAEDDVLYLQVKRGSPRIALGRVPPGA